MANKLHYRVLRGAAIVFGAGLTGYSAWLSWNHHGDPTGPIAAITGAALFTFGEYGWRDRQRLRALLMFGLGLVALVISGTAVLHRTSASQEAKLQAARSDNLPRHAANQALVEAKEALATAEGDARDECRSGRRRKCEDAEQREEAARKRVEEARTKLAGLGAQRAEDPGADRIAAFIPWITAQQYQLAAPALLPLWLELTAPLLLSLGLAPLRKEAPKAKAKRTKKRRKPRKPPAAKQARSADVLPFADRKKRA